MSSLRRRRWVGLVTRTLTGMTCPVSAGLSSAPIGRDQKQCSPTTTRMVSAGALFTWPSSQMAQLPSLTPSRDSRRRCSRSAPWLIWRWHFATTTGPHSTTLSGACQRAKDVRQQMCLPITGESFQEYTRDTDAWYGVGSDGTMVRFLGRTSPLVSDTDMKALLESVPLLPNEWEAVRDAWAADETPCPWACASDDWLTEDARDEMQDILRIPSARPYFETGGRLGSPRFYLSWELHCLADFVRLGIAMYLARNLLPTHCASESCQRYFIPTRPRQVYCSKECQRAEAVRRYRRRRAPRSA